MRKGSNIEDEKGKILSFIPTGEYYFKKGLKAYRQRNLNKAKKYFSRAFELEPLEPVIACQLAIVETELGNYEESNRLLIMIANDLDPFMNEVHYFLANNYAHMGMFQEAFKHVNEYLQKDPDGEFSEDAEDLLEVIQMDAEEAEDVLIVQDELISLQEEARNLLEAGQFEAAIEVLNKIIDNYPEFWAAYNNLSLAYYYLGKTDKAFEVIDNVLEKSPGNLHALCNTAVFMYYGRNEEELQKIIATLQKVRPILMEHQYKLGTTFALVGRYEESYFWLKNLYKKGFDGDVNFYYWLSYAAHHTGHHKTARAAWEQVLQMAPEKDGLEPWNEEDFHFHHQGIENIPSSIIKRLNSEYIEERLFGMFLLSLREDKKAITADPSFCDIENLTFQEKIYLAKVLDMELKPMDASPAIEIGHGTAQILYERFRPIGIEQIGVYLLWFSFFASILTKRPRLQKKEAYAAAIEYIWKKLRHQKASQKEVAEIYHISPATLRRYIQAIKKEVSGISI
jgi:tetratricopeptide (TPR) repeat protein